MSSAPKKYVPPSLRGSDQAAATPSRWTYTSRESNGAEQSLRNTSQASRVAPELPPAIIAPSRDAFNRPSGLVKKPVLNSADEFPAMGKAAAATPSNAWGSKPSFAELSRAWADKKKQEDEEKKAEAEKQAAIDREFRAQQEKENKERRSLMMSIHGVQRQSVKTAETIKYDMGGNDDGYYDSDPISSEDEYDENGKEEVVDDTWERSRGKHDYY